MLKEKLEIVASFLQHSCYCSFLVSSMFLSVGGKLRQTQANEDHACILFLSSLVSFSLSRLLNHLLQA